MYKTTMCGPPSCLHRANLKLPIPAIVTPARQALSDATEVGLFRLNDRALTDPAPRWKTLAYARVLHCMGVCHFLTHSAALEAAVSGRHFAPWAELWQLRPG